jgi:hypothetical protein
MKMESFTIARHYHPHLCPPPSRGREILDSYTYHSENFLSDLEISPPLVGGDKGEGDELSIHPHPYPPPSKGEGTGNFKYLCLGISNRWRLISGEFIELKRRRVYT